MLFICMLTTMEGKLDEAAKLYKHHKIPKGVRVVSSYGLFGKPDCIFVFEAQTENAAVEFVMQFGNCAISQTALAFPAEEFKWTK